MVLHVCKFRGIHRSEGSPVYEHLHVCSLLSKHSTPLTETKQLSYKQSLAKPSIKMHLSNALILAILPLTLAAPFLEVLPPFLFPFPIHAPLTHTQIRDASTASGSPVVDEDGDPIPPQIPTEQQITDIVTAAVSASKSAGGGGGGGGLSGIGGGIGALGGLLGSLTKGGKRDANHAPGHHHHGTHGGDGPILPREAKGGKGGGHKGHHGGVSINWAREAEAEANHAPGHHHHSTGDEKSDPKAGHGNASGHGKTHGEPTEVEKRQDPLAGALGGLSGLGSIGGGDTGGSNNGGTVGGAAGGLLGKVPVVGPIAGSVVGSALGGVVNGLNLPVVSGLGGAGLGGLSKREAEE